jgi:cell division protein FtsI/penicillin-binding protein 2
VSPHEALVSASGLRPLSAFVVVGAVLLAVATWVARLACGGACQPDRVRAERGLPPAYSIADRNGGTIACFVPRFDLELSPRSLWQAHTPHRIAEALSRVLGGVPTERELLAALLPDADTEGRVRVRDWRLSARQAQRIHDWLEDGAGTGRGALAGLAVEPAGDQSFQLVWQPTVLLSEAERTAHGVSQAWRWARRIADGLYACLNEIPLDVALDRSIVSESEARRAREAVWKALLPTAFARPIRGLPPDLVLALREELEAQGVAAWQMRVAYARDRVYPAGEHELFGSWGHRVPEATEPAPRDGLELVCAGLLADPRCEFLVQDAEVYRWIDARPARGVRASGYLGFSPASSTPVVRTTLDLGLQRFLGEELRATRETHEAALAMGIVLDVASGEVLAVDSVEAYPIQPFAPVYQLFTTGSTFKVVTAAVALEEGVVTPDMTLDVGNGEYRIPLPDGRPSARVIREAEGALRGSDSLERFFAFSVNAALAQVGLLVDDERFHGYLVRLGYGRPPGTGLGPERGGNLPPVPWSHAYTHASLGFGHELSTTLWRHAEALATVLRGGMRRPLSLLRSVEQGTRSLELPPEAGERIFSSETCARVRDMMRLGAREGTGRDVRRAFEASLAAATGAEPVAGSFDFGTKTGTAQKVADEPCLHVELAERARWQSAGLPATKERIESLARLAKPHARCYTSSICAFGRAPDGERELMVLLVVDEPRASEHFGSRVAGPAAQRVLVEALGLTRNGCPPSFEVAPGFGAAPRGPAGPARRSAP